MTTPTLSDYLGLITSEHDTSPRYMAMLEIFAQWAVDRRNQLAQVTAKYDLDVAVGTQLDVVGQWVGFSRHLLVPIAGVYFSFDTAGVGFDEGVWKGPFDPIEGVTSLDDDTYRLMLYTTIAANHWDGSFEEAQRLLAEFVQQSSGTLLFIQDNFDMSMTIGLSGVIPSSLFAALLVAGYLRLRPAAVDSNVIITSINGQPLFGFDTQNEYISGFDTGTWGVLSPVSELPFFWISNLSNPLAWLNSVGQPITWLSS